MKIDSFARVGAATLAVGLTLAGPHVAVAAADTGGDADSAAPAHSRTAAAKPSARAGAGDSAPVTTAAGGRSASRVARAAAATEPQSPGDEGQATHPVTIAVPIAATTQPAPQRRVTPRRAVAVAASDPAAAPVSLPPSPSEAVTVAAGPAASTATLANVAGSASSVTIAAANTDRKGLVIVNDSTAILYLKFGATASATSFTYKLNGGETYEASGPALYTGRVDGIWASATGAARVTELT